MKKDYIKYLLLAGIIFLGLILRLEGLSKPFGLGYDEAISYIIAAKKFPFEIIDCLIKTDVHMPLYFLTLSLWMKLFTNADISIRLLSVLFGILTIFFGYLAGKEIVNEKTGLLTALLISINSLAIYYSQEVRFYSLLMLLSTMVLLFFIKTIKTPIPKNIFFLIFSSLLLIYTNTISIIFVAVIFFGLALFLIFKHKDKLKIFIQALIIGQIFLLPFYWLIYEISIHHGSTFTKVLFFDNQVIFAVIQDWFSPVLIGLYNNPQNYLLNFLKNFSTESIIFVLVPIIINLILISKNNFKKPVNFLILSMILIFVLIELIESYLNKFTILPRYTLFVLPFIIVLVAAGVNNFKNKMIANFLFITLILINLIYLIFYPNSAPKMIRISGQKIPSIVLNEYKIGKQDIVIYSIRDNLSDKYYKNDFTKIKMLQIFSELYPKKSSKLDEYSYYKEIFKDEDSKIFKNYFDKEIYKKLYPKNRFIVIIQKDFMPYDAKSFNYILENDVIYRKQPILFMKLYKIASDIVRNSNKLNLKRVYTMDNWIIICPDPV